MQQKLISLSKTMLVILYAFFIFLLTLAITPWLIPTSGIGKFLLGMFGFPHYGNYVGLSYHLSYSFSLLSKMLGIAGSIVALAPLFIGTLIMLRLFKNYAAGNVFSFNNANSYRNLGIIYFFSALLLQPISQMLFSLCESINYPPGHRYLAFSFDVNNLTAIFIGIMLIVIGQVMKLGQQISEEQKLTI